MGPLSVSGLRLGPLLVPVVRRSRDLSQRLTSLTVVHLNYSRMFDTFPHYSGTNIGLKSRWTLTGVKGTGRLTRLTLCIFRALLSEHSFLLRLNTSSDCFYSWC